MPVNIGTIDQYVRIVLGLALVAYALQDGLAIKDGTGSGSSGWRLLRRRFSRAARFIPLWVSQAARSPVIGGFASARSVAHVIARRIGQILGGILEANTRRL